MFVKIESWLTLGNQYLAAAVVYFGIALLLVCSTLLDAVEATASGDTSCSHTITSTNELGITTTVIYDGCAAGLQCCGGTCIPENILCCEDGTSGSSAACSCCNLSGEQSSISCE